MLLWILVAFVVIALVDSLLIFVGIRSCGCSKPNTGDHRLVASTATNANFNSTIEPNTGTVITWQSGNGDSGIANSHPNRVAIAVSDQTGKGRKADSKRQRTLASGNVGGQKGCDCAKPIANAYADINY